MVEFLLVLLSLVLAGLAGAALLAASAWSVIQQEKVAQPEIIAIPVDDEEDEFVILGTDGLWDVMQSSEAVDLVQRLIQEGLPREQVATWMVEESIRRGTYDNVTVVIIWLDRSHPAETSSQ